MRLKILDIVAHLLGITVWVGEVRYGPKPVYESDPAN